ncbi:Uncharacterised protein [Mycobacteroides abscessus subsp. abscessus]|nr:Uncharacterised protein [Mycobacteroides abscessus subsp. abscessus]
MTKPTNPTAPQMDTKHPVIAADKMNSATRNRPASRPSDALTSSPMARALSWRASPPAQRIPITVAASATGTLSQDDAPRLPSSQNMTLRAASPFGARNTRTVVTADNP